MVNKQFINAKGECTSYYACYLGDWSYDLFFKACETTKALPIKGVYPSRNASDEKRFVAFLKSDFKDYKENLEREYDTTYLSLEDVFERFCREYNFSDWYKDTFNQRPHLDASFYLYAMGYENVGGLRFCMSPFADDVEEALWSAKEYRKYLESLAFTE